MNDSYNLLKLHISQAEQSLYRASNNCYSDQHKQEYQYKLQTLFKAFTDDVVSSTTLTDSQIYDKYKSVLDFIFKSLEFLDSSTLNQIPYEIVECLNYAMNDWLDPTDSYIIVTSLINSAEDFSFDPSLAFNDALYADLKTRYKIDFTYRLVQINLPRAISRDYLSAVVLYHELGHFIDMKYSLMESLTRVMLDKLTNNYFRGEDLIQLLKYFPFLHNFVGRAIFIQSNHQEYYITRSHLREYFCDLFAAQYIGESYNHYLTYITKGSSTLSRSHPSTTNRVQVVQHFLSGTQDILVNLCNEVMDAVNKKHLTILYDTISGNDFFELIPLDVTSIKELHGIFPCAWNIWLNQQDKLLISLNLTPLSTTKLYTVINNLVEKSIGNYITINRWKQALKP